MKNEEINNEVFELICEYKTTGDIKIRNKIFDKTINLVKKYVYNHCVNIVYCVSPTYPSYDDLVQEGSYVLLDSIKKFDVTRGIKFSTFLIYCLKSKMALFVKRAKSKIQKYDIISLNQLVDTPQGRNLTLENMVASQTNFEKRIVEKMDVDYILNEILPLFPESDRQIFTKYYIEDISQPKIAKQMNCTSSYVSKRLNSLIDNLKTVYEKGVDCLKNKPRKTRTLKVNTTEKETTK